MVSHFPEKYLLLAISGGLTQTLVLKERGGVPTGFKGVAGSLYKQLGFRIKPKEGDLFLKN